MTIQKVHGQFMTWLLALTLSLSFPLAGCGGGSAAPQLPISVVLTPSGAQSTDQGQTVNITAKVINDLAGQGVTWSLSGPGTLSNTTLSSVTYNAPTSGSSNVTATVTATSKADTTKNASVMIAVAPRPAITTTSASLPAGNVGVGYNATVNGTGGSAPFNWSVKSLGLPSGIGFSGCSIQTQTTCDGTGTNSVGLNGTPTLQGPSNFTLTVTDAVGLSASQALAITIGPPLPLKITTTSPLPDGIVNNPYQRFFTTIFGTGGVLLSATGGLQPYTWSLAAGSSLPSGLAIDTSGHISGTPTTAGTFSFGIMLSDVETPPLTTTTTFSLTVHTQLFGQNVFLFNGTDANGAVVAAGSFAADDLGNITSGVEDINRHVGAPATNVSFIGSYSIGADNRGTLTFTSALGTSTFAFAIGLSSNPFGTSGRFIEFDASGTRGSGIIERQTSTACTLASLSGEFAFGISGDDSNKGRVALAGRFHADGAGNLSNGFLDEDDAGTLSSDVAWTGSYAAAPSSSPRCTATFTPTGLLALNFALYPVSLNEALLVEVNPVATKVPLAAGRVLAQGALSIAGPPNTFLNAPSAAGLTGFSAGANGPDVRLVFFSPDGNGNFTLTQDENNGGVVTTSTVVKGTYNVSPEGRATLAGGKNLPVLYVTRENEAFVVGIDNGATSGHLEGQSGSLSNATIAGNFISGTETPASAKVSELSGVESFDGVSGLTGTSDESTPSATTPDQAFTGMYSVTNTPVNGHGTLTITPAGGSPASFVFLSSVRQDCIHFFRFGRCGPAFVKLVAIPTDSTQTNPAVLVFEQ